MRMLNARPYAGTVVDSDHKRVIRLNRVFGLRGRTRSTKRYPVESLSNAVIARNYKFHLTSCMNEVNTKLETTDTAQNRTDSIVTAIHKAALSSNRITPPTRSNWQAVCHDITRMSHEQNMLRPRIDNTTDIESRNSLKQECNRLLYTIKRKALENASVKLDQIADVVERLHDCVKMSRPVRLLYSISYKQPTIHDDRGRTVVDPVEFGKLVTDVFSVQFRGEKMLEFQHSSVNLAL